MEKKFKTRQKNNYLKTETYRYIILFLKMVKILRERDRKEQNSLVGKIMRQRKREKEENQIKFF